MVPLLILLFWGPENCLESSRLIRVRKSKLIAFFSRLRSRLRTTTIQEEVPRSGAALAQQPWAAAAEPGGAAPRGRVGPLLGN